MKKLLSLAVLLMSAGAANAAIFDVTLNQVLAGRADNPSAPLSNLSGSATDPLAWNYCDTCEEVSTTGTLNAGVNVNVTPLFFDTLVAPTIGGGTATATSFTCTNGLFAQIVGAQVCGGYNFGGNGTDDSSLVYSQPPTTTSFTLTIGGDDVVDGDVRTIGEWYMTVVQFDGPGGILALETADYFSFENGPCEDIDENPTGNCDSAGLRMEFSVVPVPAAVWLFGSALGLLGFVRSRVSG